MITTLMVSRTKYLNRMGDDPIIVSRTNRSAFKGTASHPQRRGHVPSYSWLKENLGIATKTLLFLKNSVKRIIKSVSSPARITFWCVACSHTSAGPIVASTGIG